MTKKLLHSERSGLPRIKTSIILTFKQGEEKPPTSKLLLIETTEYHRNRIEINKRHLSSLAHFALAGGVVCCHL